MEVAAKMECFSEDLKEKLKSCCRVKTEWLGKQPLNEIAFYD